MAAAAGRRARPADAALLKQIYPEVDIARHIVGDPITVSWEHDPNFMGAFKANLPGHYRYQRRLFCHFMQDGSRPSSAASSSPATTSPGPRAGPRAPCRPPLNAVWGVVRHLGGRTHRENPGPGDRLSEDRAAGARRRLIVRVNPCRRATSGVAQHPEGRDEDVQSPSSIWRPWSGRLRAPTPQLSACVPRRCTARRSATSFGICGHVALRRS